ncbi:hypothetical protein HDU91_006800, partial [Kappamyces sp. JEL0680]
LDDWLRNESSRTNQTLENISMKRQDSGSSYQSLKRHMDGLQGPHYQMDHLLAQSHNIQSFPSALPVPFRSSEPTSPVESLGHKRSRTVSFGGPALTQQSVGFGPGFANSLGSTHAPFVFSLPVPQTQFIPPSPIYPQPSSVPLQMNIPTPPQQQALRDMGSLPRNSAWLHDRQESVERRIGNLHVSSSLPAFGMLPSDAPIDIERMVLDMQLPTEEFARFNGSKVSHAPTQSLTSHPFGLSKLEQSQLTPSAPIDPTSRASLPNAAVKMEDGFSRDTSHASGLGKNSVDKDLVASMLFSTEHAELRVDTSNLATADMRDQDMSYDSTSPAVAFGPGIPESNPGTSLPDSSIGSLSKSIGASFDESFTARFQSAFGMKKGSSPHASQEVDMQAAAVKENASPTPTAAKPSTSVPDSISRLNSVFLDRYSKASPVPTINTNSLSLSTSLPSPKGGSVSKARKTRRASAAKTPKPAVEKAFKLETGDDTPREQKLKFPEDLYTPKLVRFQGAAKEGLCDLCDPGKWLQLKNSAFW